MSDHGPGIKVEVIKNSMLPHGNNYMKLYNNRTRKIINQDNFKIPWEKCQVGEIEQSSTNKPPMLSGDILGFGFSGS